ncbi:MAG: hydrogenase small subunit [Armatimonadota bacterium]|nr:MAG: hydrogenase small subunit [Armatimonadota bacterium]
MPRRARTRRPRKKEYPAIWLQCAGCSGCSVALLNAESPTAKNFVVDQLVPGAHVSLRFHPTIMAASGEMALTMTEAPAVPESGYLLVVEGAVPTAHERYGGVGEKAGRHLDMLSKVRELAQNAMAVISVGTCSSFGGIPAGHPNPTACKPVTEVLEEVGISTPVINIPGCPPHPDWFVGAVASLLLFGMPQPADLDVLRRPKRFFGKLIHENCPRRADFEAGKFARAIGEPGCLYELGCRGPITSADCPERMFNSAINWCIKAGSPCMGCVEPEFPDVVSPLYRKTPEQELPHISVGADGSLVACKRPTGGPEEQE